MEAPLTFLTQPNCHLCADALPLVRAAAERYKYEISVVDITSDDALVAEYGFRIPVVVAGEQVLCEGLITRRNIRKALRRYRRAKR